MIDHFLRTLYPSPEILKAAQCLRCTHCSVCRGGGANPPGHLPERRHFGGCRPPGMLNETKVGEKK